jgi:hypothetical protein
LIRDGEVAFGKQSKSKKRQPPKVERQESKSGKSMGQKPLMPYAESSTSKKTR